FVSQHCLACHSGEDPAGYLSLECLTLSNSEMDESELWNDVAETVSQGEMPPKIHHSQPTPEAVSHFLSALQKRALLKRQIAQPVASMRRLTRQELENTIGDLFQLRSPLFHSPDSLVLNDKYFQPQSRRMPNYMMVFSHHEWSHRNPSFFENIPALPHDPPVEHGFRNNQTGISFSPLQMERQFEFVGSLLNHPEFQRSSAIWSELFECEYAAWNQQLKYGEQQLDTFIPRAFRRPANPVSKQRWKHLFQEQLRENRNYTTAMKTTVQAMLVSPSFLFRTDRLACSDGFPDWSIASRLSYFLWGSMPDETLFLLAAQGELKNQRTVRQQVRRMLQDRRARWLSTSFGMQWLQTMKAISSRPDENLYEHYYQDMRHSLPGVFMAIEQMLLFETILVENRSILDFIDADFGYLNQVLMNWYGLDPQSLIGFIPKPEDTEDFFRIQWPDRKRGGIICSGATLVSTSATHRTSPVFRGAWILEVIFNRPPPAPPANVPELASELAHGSQPLNIRERLAIHRHDKNCAVCHDAMDPPGFALERYDAVGQLRVQYADGTAIDSKGAVSGITADGIEDLKDVILRQQDKFTQGFVEKLFEFAIGRKLDRSDLDTIEDLVETAQQHQLAFQNIIEEVALHSVFPESSARVPQSHLSSRPQNHPK
ncbi:MAG: DUF1592 domain-containing protein, partial [Pirellulaceae bacterium]|nr:DUF1592 domain-containing protein [Pirellulaceae bacterium]